MVLKRTIAVPREGTRRGRDYVQGVKPNSRETSFPFFCNDLCRPKRTRNDIAAVGMDAEIPGQCVLAVTTQRVCKMHIQGFGTSQELVYYRVSSLVSTSG